MNSRVRIVPAAFKHVGRIANRMRTHDRIECQAMGRAPKQSLRMGLMLSEHAWTALVDGQAEAMFGVVVDNTLSGEATPWFLGTDEVYRHGREMLMWGPGMLARLGDSRRKLSNLVSSANTPAIRLLRRWGFEVSEDEVVVRGVPFRQFVKEAA